ncbi:hypothetical protein [Vibrio alfacsensis]|uniref:hypothetical protein n=1 Tax=Vibrio alfacsensis TaxID=1074311 RepID=UPI0040675E99
MAELEGIFGLVIMTINQVVINQEMEKWLVVATVRSVQVKRKPNVYRGFLFTIGALAICVILNWQSFY